jgi:hypothetical protein
LIKLNQQSLTLPIICLDTSHGQPDQEHPEPFPKVSFISSSRFWFISDFLFHLCNKQNYLLSCAFKSQSSLSPSFNFIKRTSDLGMVVLRDSILDDASFHPLFYLYLYHSISLGLGRIIPDRLCSIMYRVIGIRQNYDDVIVAPVSIIPAPLFNEQTVSIGSKTILQTHEALLQNTLYLIIPV